jgi:hypothetical protein
LLMDDRKPKIGQYPVCFARFDIICASELAPNIGAQSMIRTGLYEVPYLERSPTVKV